MSKKIFVKTLLPITTIALLGGVAAFLVLTSCSNKKNDPSHYVGNMDGTNWKGRESGHILCTPEDDGECTLDLSDTEIAYSATNWVIPYKVKNLVGDIFNVKKIVGSSFQRNDLVLKGSLIIPNSVVDIGDYAFYDCSRLTGSLTIPDSVASIGTYGFSYCTNFTGSLTIPNDVISIGVYAFAWCSGLTGSLTIGSGVESIGERAFHGCSSLTGSLTIPNNVTSIEYRAFSECNFEDILIDIDGTNPTYGLATNVGDAKIVVEKDSQGECSKDYGEEDIAGCLAVGQLTIPNGVTSIGNNAFDGCSGLTGSLTIPDSVIRIGVAGFNSCTGLTGSLTIGSGVSSIGNYAFGDCIGLTGSLTIPDSVNSIGAFAFRDCIGLTGSLTIPNDVISIGMYVFAWCGFTGSLTIGSGVGSIGGWAFYDCSGFTNVTLDGYSSVPSWTVGTDIFHNWNNDSTSTVSTLNGSLIADDALDYLISIGLPDNWTAA